MHGTESVVHVPTDVVLLVARILLGLVCVCVQVHITTTECKKGKRCVCQPTVLSSAKIAIQTARCVTAAAKEGEVPVQLE